MACDGEHHNHGLANAIHYTTTASNTTDYRTLQQPTQHARKEDNLSNQCTPYLGQTAPKCFQVVLKDPMKPWLRALAAGDNNANPETDHIAHRSANSTKPPASSSAAIASCLGPPPCRPPAAAMQSHPIRQTARQITSSKGVQQPGTFAVEKENDADFAIAKEQIHHHRVNRDHRNYQSSHAHQHHRIAEEQTHHHYHSITAAASQPPWGPQCQSSGPQNSEGHRHHDPKKQVSGSRELSEEQDIVCVPGYHKMPRKPQCNVPSEVHDTNTEYDMEKIREIS